MNGVVNNQFTPQSTIYLLKGLEIDAMNNTFTPSTSLVARGDENEVRTRIYSVNERTIQIDELSMPINIPSTATQEAETEN